jgi:pyruvate kinase
VVASLGPALGSESEIAAAIELDADFRQPFGYRLQNHLAQFAMVQRLRTNLGKAARVYVDLPSERPRIGVLTSERHFKLGQCVRIVTADESGAFGRCGNESVTRPDEAQPSRDRGYADEVPIPALEKFLPALEPGHRLLIRDGHTVVRIKQVRESEVIGDVECAVEGVATNNNVMFPDSAVLFEPVVDADRELLERYRHAGFAPDWVMLSLITSSAQVENARAVLSDIFGERTPKIMVKIETAKSVQRMNELLAACDGLLVGRGDLGMTMPPECIPAIQEDVVMACRAANKPVLVATEFLQRFAETGVPNRAELSDVALAARQGVDGIVLTKETSGSPHAQESVRLAYRVIKIEAGRTR